MAEPLIFSTQASEYFAKLISNHLHIPVCEIERKIFGGGEKYYRIGIKERADLVGRDVVFVASTHTDEDLLELYRVGCALAGYGVRRAVYVIPFLGYSTMERAVKPGEVVTAKTIARSLSGIPSGDQRNVFLMMDLHISGLAHYFEGNCLRFELYAEKILVETMNKLGWCNDPGKIIFASADLGRPMWVRSFAEKFGTGIAMVNKKRNGGRTEITEVIGDVKDKDVIIYDDMVRSGGSLVNAANAYLNRGASKVNAVVSHFALNDDRAFARLLKSFPGHIITTNSHPMSQNIGSISPNREIIVADVSVVFAETIMKVFGWQFLKDLY